MYYSFPFRLPFSFIFTYLTKLHQITSIASHSSEYLKKMLRRISFSVPWPQGTCGLLWETNEHIIKCSLCYIICIFIYNIYYKIYIYIYKIIYINTCRESSSLSYPFLSALSNYNIARVSWHSCFWLSALKYFTCCLKIISLKHCFVNFRQKWIQGVSPKTKMKCNVESWIRSWNRKRISVKKLIKVKEVHKLVNNSVPLLLS